MTEPAKKETVKKTKAKTVKKRTVKKKATAKPRAKPGPIKDITNYKPTRQKRAYATKLRRNMSMPERILWKRLKTGWAGVEWKAQSVILGYIADFFCPLKRIVVEVDSKFHEGREDYDNNRDKAMNEHGITVLRVQAKDININVGVALLAILRVVEKVEDNPWPAAF